VQERWHEKQKSRLTELAHYKFGGNHNVKTRKHQKNL